MEANTFASEFLMPSAGIKSNLYNLKMTDLAELKRILVDINGVNRDESEGFGVYISRTL